MTHLKRQKATTKLPIPRKGTTFIARPRSNLNNSVSVVAAVRDMLKLARSTKEVKKMIHNKSLKLNGKLIRDHRESISLFNLLEADKSYFLTLLPTKKFSLSPSKTSDTTLCKITNKKILSKDKIQLNCHDGTNLISKDKISVGDSVHIDFSGKIKKHIILEKGKSIFIMSGKYVGLEGKIESKKGKKIEINIDKKEIPTTLNEYQIIAK